MQHGADAAGSDSSASQAGPIVAPEVDEAVVTFEAEHAYVSVKDQILYAKTLTTELHKELKFAASADTATGFPRLLHATPRARTYRSRD